MTRAVLCGLLLVAALAAHARAQCAMEPPAGATNSLRSPGDGGFGLHISGDPERYVPGSVYTREYRRLVALAAIWKRSRQRHGLHGLLPRPQCR